MIYGPEQLSPEDFFGSLLPSQYFEHVERRKLESGEYRLVLAVLNDAVRSYVSNIGARSREQRARLAELRRWFYSHDDPLKQGVFSFESVCDLLGIEAGIVRRRLRAIGVHDLPTRRYHAPTRGPRITRRLARTDRRGPRLVAKQTDVQRSEQVEPAR